MFIHLKIISLHQCVLALPNCCTWFALIAFTSPSLPRFNHTTHRTTIYVCTLAYHQQTNVNFGQHLGLKRRRLTPSLLAQKFSMLDLIHAFSYAFRLGAKDMESGWKRWWRKWQGPERMARDGVGDLGVAKWCSVEAESKWGCSLSYFWLNSNIHTYREILYTLEF